VFLIKYKNNVEDKIELKLNQGQKNVYEINSTIPPRQTKSDPFAGIMTKPSIFNISSIVDKSKLAALSEEDTEQLIAEIVRAKIDLDHRGKAEKLVLGAKNALSTYSTGRNQNGSGLFTESEPIINNQKLNVHIENIEDNLEDSFDIDTIFVNKNYDNNQSGGYKTKVFKSFLTYLGVKFN